MGGMGTKTKFSEATWQIFPIGYCKDLCFYLLIYVLPILALVVVVIDLIIWNFVGLRGKQTGL